jgi:branched-chain amino acid aminotransferase
MVTQVADDLGYRVSQENIPRELLYIADEVFFVGTAVEITPVRSVDKIQVGAGRRGPVTEAIQRRFLDVIAGKAPDSHKWLTYVPAMATAGVKQH